MGPLLLNLQTKTPAEPEEPYGPTQRSRQPELRASDLIATFDITTQLEINRACLHGMSAPDTESEKLVLLHI